MAPYYGTIQNYASVQGNTLVAYSNPASSAQALAAYEKTAILPAHVIAATTAGQVLTSAASTPTTLLGDSGTTFVGSTNETNFVSGYDAHRLLGGEGANIFTFLAISDSTASAHDTITNFDPAKDVIDLSRIDANITTPGLQHFTFIGTAPFSGTGAQVRYQLDPATDQTYVEADLAGDSGNYYARFRNRDRGTRPSHRRQLRPDGGSVGHGHRKWGCAYRNQGSNADRRDERIRVYQRQRQELFFL